MSKITSKTSQLNPIQQQLRACQALIRLRESADFQYLVSWLQQRCQWQIKDPSQAKSIEQYGLDNARAFGYSALYAEMVNYLENLEQELAHYTDLQKEQDEADKSQRK